MSVIVGTQPPADAVTQLQAGLAHHRAGRRAEAEAIYRAVLAADPGRADGWHLLGVLAHETDDLATAHRYIEHALMLRPQFPEALLSLGNVLKAAGQLDEAVAAYRKLVALAPALGEAWNNLGNALLDQRAFDEAEAAFRKALAIQPHQADFWSNLGALLIGRGDLSGAVEVYRRALAISPGHGAAHLNLGVALQDSGRVDEALAAYRQAVAALPAEPLAHYNLALGLLIQGRLAEGFQAYEWRWRTPAYPKLRFDQPLWDGAPFPGRTLLVHAEQGLGDTLQFVRYGPSVKALGGRVLLACQPPLVGLLAELRGFDQVVPVGGRLPEFDLRVPLLSLPQRMGTTLESVSGDVPYLGVDPARQGRWTGLIPDRGRRRIGLVWAGSPSHRKDQTRSIDLALLRPLIEQLDADWFGLQTGPRAGAIMQLGLAGRIVDLSPHLVDFRDTAAALTHLDLVIAVDTAVAHLAGGLARPVWLMLPHAPDWRWLLNRADSPWYPTMRLFRQSRPGAWPAVVDAISRCLADGAAPRA